MPPVESPTALGLVDAVREKVKNAPAPLKLADVAKGLPKPKKMKVAEVQEEARRLLDEDVRLGRAFCFPSGKGGAVRYWARDERQMLRDRAVEAASEPQPLSALKARLGKDV